MELKPLRCPSCGANLSVPDNASSFFCSYCGTKVVQNKQYVELSGEVSVKGMATVDSLLDRAFLFLEDRSFTSAKQYFERVLDIQPKASKAYTGQLLCLLQLTSMDDLATVKKPLTTYDLFNKAMRFATPAEKTVLCGYQEQVENRLNARRQEYEGRIHSAEDTIMKYEIQLSQDRKDYRNAKAKKVLWVILIILSSIGAAFFIIVALATDPILLILAAPFVPLLVFFIKKLKKAKRSISAYEQNCNALQQETTSLDQIRDQYRQWQGLLK